MDKKIRVFISYSWDSPNHKTLMKNLAKRLRQNGIDCWIDQDEHPSQKSWPRWMNEQIKEADYVLCCFTEKYLKRYKGQRELDGGQGADFEGLVISNKIYLDRSPYTKFIPIIPPGGSWDHICDELNGTSRYKLDSDSDFDELLRHINTPIPVVSSTSSKPAPPQTTSPVLSSQQNSPQPYSSEAIADVDFYSENKFVQRVLSVLKTYNWYEQANGVISIKSLDQSTWLSLSRDDAFVLGRNIYQCADGDERTAKDFLVNLRQNLAPIPRERACDLLSGMLFEAYFNKEGKLREIPKYLHLGKLLALQGARIYDSAIDFINQQLQGYKSILPFLPNTSPEIVEVKIGLSSENPDIVDSITIDGREFVGVEQFDDDGYSTSTHEKISYTFTKRNFKPYLSEIWGIPEEQLKISWPSGINADGRFSLLPDHIIQQIL